MFVCMNIYVYVRLLVCMYVYVYVCKPYCIKT